MKILNLNQFSEKLNATNVDLSELQQINVEPYFDVDGTIEKIINGIEKYCSYQRMGNDGFPVGCGELLDKYGYDCNFTIRDKEFSVYSDYTEDNIEFIRIDWVTQDTIDDKYSNEALKGMFTELMKKLKLENIPIQVIVYAGCRDNFGIEYDDPEYILIYKDKQFTWYQI